MKFDFIYFDSGGTIYGLFDGEDPHPNDFSKTGLLRVEALLHAYGHNYAIADEQEALEQSRQWCLHTYGSMKFTFYQQLQQFFEILHLTVPNEIIVCLSDAFAEPRLSSWIFPGTLQAFKDLTAAGIGLGIIANTVWSSYNMDRAFEGVGLLPYVSHRVYSGNIHCAKPDMAIFEYAEKIGGLKGKRVLYVGNDIKNDIQAAKSFGWSAALRTSEQVPCSDGVADIDFDDIDDLTQFCLTHK